MDYWKLELWIMDIFKTGFYLWNEFFCIKIHRSTAGHLKTVDWHEHALHVISGYQIWNNTGPDLLELLSKNVLNDTWWNFYKSLIWASRNISGVGQPDQDYH